MAQNKKHSHRKLMLVGPNAPFQYVEAYKSLRTNLSFLSGTSNCKVILITSSVPEEGKSNVAINLSMTLAQGGKRVLLMDCDLRKGSLSRYLNVRRSHPGISNVVAGQCNLAEAMASVGGAEFTLLPVGPIPPNPAEMLATDKMASLVKAAREAFDYVIVDTPPVSVVTDAAVMSRLVDGVVLVVRPGITTIQGAQLSKKNLEAVNAHVLGVILNGYNTKQASRRDGYYYSYTYDYYKHEEDDEDKSSSKRKKN